MHWRNEKSPGPDELFINIIQVVKGKHMKILLQFFNKVFYSGVIPRKWLLSIFFCFPKKSNARESHDDHTIIISLMSHTQKLFLKIIHNRIYLKFDMDIDETQIGFTKVLSTPEALFYLMY